ncbi:hypothetical protein ACF08N_07995 [Streptomyces sp. NPDC015127]
MPIDEVPMPDEWCLSDDLAALVRQWVPDEEVCFSLSPTSDWRI